jgi:2,3-dihydroxyphenylpropionate 1,2-dioxygenase
MDALTEGGAALDALCAMSEDSIEREAGLSAHESKNWLVARSALPTDRALPCSLRHYQAIPEYIAGFGVMLLKQPQ